MSKRFIDPAFVFVVMLAAIPLRAGEVIDRIVATVNGHIILQSEVDEAIAYQAFAEDHALVSISNEQGKAALDRLIDQELIGEAIRKTSLQPVTPAEVDARIAEIRKAHAEVGDDASWLAALHRYGLSADDLREKVTADLNSWKAVDARLRPNVAVESRSIERYYQDNLLPELHKSGAPEVPLAAVAPKIKEILAQQQINDLLAAWLKSLRAESKIQIAANPSRGAAGGSR